MSNNCVNELDTCVIRGGNYALDVGLSAAFKEVIDDPANYLGVMTFRDQQSDLSPALLTLSVTPEINPDPLLDEAPANLRFRATPTQTQVLPSWDIVHYVEIRNLVGSQVGRLFEGDVSIGD